MLKAVRISAIAMALSVAALPSVSQGPGADTYKAKCQMCHGADGMGGTPAGKAMKALPFNSPEITSKSDADLIAATKNGKGKMPAYKDKLSDAEIKQVIAFVHTLQKK